MFARNPFFESELVVNTQWKIYYSWHMQIGPKCVEISFKNATKEIVHRVWSDMNEYLEMQPNWEAAALLLNIGSSRREVMLFTEQGPAGGFTGVPNIVRDGNIPPLRKSVSLIKFHMKLVESGRYLVVMDCQLGVASLSARSNAAVTLADVIAVAMETNLGEGHAACTVARDNEDPFIIKQYI
ncbi:PREDICTED: uncharacterized protein LOC106117737 [Papilio xuthus]|uniref:Uncharacterized protein LOC106117737 n=1 Tax=Papilio xuthus TaxID=66420 RepID=A0A0N0PFA2_PAPXU|nr:PREDICTED: uncharacterized protein LOC106117737 [Papilio xuthus]KPJ20632.1 hypothetical protein RR46_01065 [Papilio xuthus]